MVTLPYNQGLNLSLLNNFITRVKSVQFKILKCVYAQNVCKIEKVQTLKLKPFSLSYSKQ